jgi:hypothetical protein
MVFHFGMLACLQVALFCVLLRYSSSVLPSGVFFRGLGCAAISAAFIFILPSLGLCWSKDIRDRLVVSSLGFSISVVFLVVLPVTVDRSVSVFLLSYLSDLPESRADEKTLTAALHEVYIDEYEAAHRRMKEQIEVGNIRELENGRFELTSRGEKFVALSRAISDFFALDPRYVRPAKSKDSVR